jgi:bifunctional non-homologous end joining protein LigD
MIQLASDSGNAAALVFFLFDLLYLDGEDLCPWPLIERKARLAELLSNATSPLHYCDHQIGHGREFHDKACAMGLEGVVSKRADAAYAPGNRGLWVKVKCLHREEFVVVGWTDPEGSRPYFGALLLAYYDPDGRLLYAGRVGTGIKQAELERLWRPCSRSLSTRCRSTCRRHAAAVSAHRCSSAACTGSGPSWSRK